MRISGISIYSITAALLAFSLVNTADAANKCVDANGKTTYSDEPCAKGNASSKVDTKGTVIDHSEIRRELKKTAPDEKSRTTNAKPASPSPQTLVLTEAEDVQIRNYAMTVANTGAYAEAREVSEREVRRIRLGDNRKFSGAELEERSAFIRAATVAVNVSARRDAINSLVAFDANRDFNR
ncbi:MAG: DUF4124 domain-containing protein [Burkholderiales bacterium]|jgi:hypothetical protein